MTDTARTAGTFPPPVMEARRWLDGVTFPADRPLINVSQAAPVDPPPNAMRQAMADALLHQDASHLYGPVLGLPDLRAELAEQTSRIYGAQITAQNVAITSGCNQAFAATISALCCDGDDVILPTPWYFNHKMWLDMAGVNAVPLTTGPDLLPDPDQAAALITPRTRAIALVSPNNPGGVEYPTNLIAAFRDLCRSKSIKLIIDETYRDFHSQTGAPHDLMQDPEWHDTVVQLYSFSKAYRLTGHRIGALIASPKLLAEVEKFLDTVTICPSQVGQIGALWGMQNLGDWLAEQRLEILRRKRAIEAGFPALAAKGWQLLGCGAYFAYMRHPFDTPSDRLAPELVKTAGLLCLPGTMFHPNDYAPSKSELRIAFANLDADGIAHMYDRLSAL
ncbi:MAG: aminotransferase [Paracoccaceae bacterium]